MPNPRQALSILNRRLQDCSHISWMCYAKAVRYFLQYKAIRSMGRPASILPLSHAHSLLITGQAYSVPESKLMAAIEKSIARECAKGGLAHSHPRRVEAASDSDIQYFRRYGGVALKAPRIVGGEVAEKGVLLLNFSENFRTFRRCVDVASVLRDYVLVLEPGWSGLADFDILYFTRFADHKVVVMAVEERDRRFLQRLGANLVPIALGSGDWVNPSVFRPIEGQAKEYHAVMVATWLPFKRHQVLFRALGAMNDRSFRVALVSYSPENREEVEALIDAYGVRDNIDVFEGVAQEEVNAVLNRSKVNIVLSLQEGGNRALFEGFFAGVPGLALRCNVGIAKDYFTPTTGRLVRERDLVSELLWFREHWREFDPRAWATANITPEITTAKLNSLLEQMAVERGEAWTTDHVVKCNAPNCVYYPDACAGEGLPSMSDILSRYANSTSGSHASGVACPTALQTTN